MNKIIWFLRGYVVLEVTGAAPEWALNRLTAGRIPFWDVTWQDPFSLRLSILRKDGAAAQRLIEGAMCQGKKVAEESLYRFLGGILRRPVLLTMLIFSTAAVLLLPGYALFYSVEGNATIPEEQILQNLEDLGIGFGRYGPSIKPQWVKDHMLNLIPRLQWITVTQSGCKATVVVRERPDAPKTENRKAYANVYATQSGVITRQSVLAGQPLCKTGDAVEKGDLLVSGMVNLERVWMVENAKAEIYAATWREKKTVIPQFYQKKQYEQDPWRCVWLLFGEKRIKIFGNSGIFGASCDKMIERKTLTLPDGLTLPVSLEIETFLPYTSSRQQLPEISAQLLLTAYAEGAARSDMVAGEVQKAYHVLTRDLDCYALTSMLKCHEMIAESVEEEWMEEEIADD